MEVDPRRAQEVFLEAVAHQDAADRAAILERECSADRPLRDRVEALLRAHDEASGRGEAPQRRRGLGIAALLLAVLALLTPLGRAQVYGRVGLLLVQAAVLEIAHGFRRSTAQGQRSAWFGGLITLAMGLLLINAPYLAVAALWTFLAGWFGLDGIRYLLDVLRRAREGRFDLLEALACLGNLAAAAVILALRGEAVAWTVAIAGAVRIFGTAWNILVSPVFTARDTGDTVVGDLDLTANPELSSLARRVAEEEAARAPIDRGWVLGFLATLLAIHVGRMGFDRTVLGIIAPGFAVLGDLLMALLLAFAVVVPSGVFWRRLTRGPERRLWAWYLAVPEGRRGWVRRAVGAAMIRRLRASIRLRRARYSLGSALSRGLQIGLPLAAIIAATVPVWGMSWYFDTENWAAGIWNSWAEERTDSWREAMVGAASPRAAAAGPRRALAITPAGVSRGGDFSFIVIGDTGEGDASQHSLRDQYLKVVRTEDGRFVIVSSDVVYPAGAMRDYEAKCWLPFMGTTRPVYAIPGNHDWYDALEGFAATFLRPDAARAAIRARVEADKRMTSTTDRRIEELIAEASRLRQEYGVPTQLQEAPYFQLQTDSFALFAVDTGVARRVDPAQWAWLRGALESARGKLKMAILGHPLYAGGRYLGQGDPDFAALHRLLREHDVAIVMAGDTHDLEYYAERRAGSPRVMHHFVNGGGGAYLSFGTALDWPDRPATAEWVYYPSTAAVVAKIEATTPRWKWPAWWWTKRFGGWPFSAEWLSAAFDANVAPFYQSFIEVRVEPSKGRVRLLPYGVHGRLHWSEVGVSPDARPPDARLDSPMEWVVEMPRES
jgi:uncharacterized membrane protein HdeD (DUF308 family)